MPARKYLAEYQGKQGNMDIKSKINEAKVYHSMGLLKESLHIYEEILSDLSITDPNNTETVREKIRQFW